MRTAGRSRAGGPQPLPHTLFSAGRVGDHFDIKDPIINLEPVDNFHAANHAAENRVTAIKVRLR